MNRRSPIPRLTPLLTEVPHKLLHARDIANFLSSFDVFSSTLRFSQCRKRFDLPVVETCRFPESLQTHALRRCAVKFRKRTYGIVPHLRPLFRRDAGEIGFGEYAAVEELHDIKRTSYYLIVLGKPIHFWHRDISVLQRM